MPAAKAKRKPVRQLDLLVLADVTSEGFVLFLSSRNTTVFRQVPFVSYFVVVIAAAIFCYLNRFSRPPPSSPPPPPPRTQKRSIRCTCCIQTPSLGRICPFYDAHQSAASPRSIFIYCCIAPRTRGAISGVEVLAPPAPPPPFALGSATVCWLVRVRTRVCFVYACVLHGFLRTRAFGRTSPSPEHLFCVSLRRSSSK